MQQALGARHDRHEGTEIHHLGDLAFIDGAHFGFCGDLFHATYGFSRLFTGLTIDLHTTIVFQVDGAAGLFGQRTDGGATTYSVDGGPAQTYEAGQPVEVGGLSITLNGQPADGDRLDMGKAENMNTDLFKTFEKALAVLDKPAVSDAEKAARANTINTAMREFDNSLDNVLTVRASVGSRLNELKVVDGVADNRQLNYTETYSNLIGDLSDPANFAEVVSQYSLRQVSLQAAQKAFVDIKSMSLFDRM